VALAYQPFFGLVPAPVPFRDAAFSICTYSLSVIDVLKGVSKSLAQERFNFATFNPDLYDRMDRIEHGDCTWIIPGKLMAFSGPQAQKREISPGVFTLSIDEYIPLFKKYGVTGVIRFNKKIYDRQVLISGGINHYDLYYEVRRIIEIFICFFAFLICTPPPPPTPPPPNPSRRMEETPPKRSLSGFCKFVNKKKERWQCTARPG